MIRCFLTATIVASVCLNAGSNTADEPDRPHVDRRVPTSKEVRLTGWITDEWCGAGNANAKGADCARHCNDNGAALVLFSGGKLYRLSDQGLARRYIGYPVTVEGRLAEDDPQPGESPGPVVTVTSIRRAKKS